MAPTKLYVGRLPYSVTDEELNELFAEFGTVVSAKVIMDRDTGQSRGFGFVEMASEDEANASIKGNDGKEVKGRAISVSIAKPMENRPPRGDYNNRS